MAFSPSIAIALVVIGQLGGEFFARGCGAAGDVVMANETWFGAAEVLGCKSQRVIFHLTGAARPILDGFPTQRIFPIVIFAVVTIELRRLVDDSISRHHMQLGPSNAIAIYLEVFLLADRRDRAQRVHRSSEGVRHGRLLEGDDNQADGHFAGNHRLAGGIVSRDRCWPGGLWLGLSPGQPWDEDRCANQAGKNLHEVTIHKKILEPGDSGLVPEKSQTRNQL